MFLYFCFFSLWLTNIFLNATILQKIHVHTNYLISIKTCDIYCSRYLHVVSYPKTKFTWTIISKKLLVNKNEKTVLFLALLKKILHELQYTVLTVYKNVTKSKLSWNVQQTKNYSFFYTVPKYRSSINYFWYLNWFQNPSLKVNKDVWIDISSSALTIWMILYRANKHIFKQFKVFRYICSHYHNNTT